MRDLISDLLPTPIILAALSADNTSAALDIRGFSAAMLYLGVGIGGITFDDTNKIEFKLSHCETAGGVYVPVTDADVRIKLPDLSKGAVGANGIIRSLVTAHAAPTITRVHYQGRKPFLKLFADFSGAHGTATPIGAFLVKGDAYVGPV